MYGFSYSLKLMTVWDINYHISYVHSNRVEITTVNIPAIGLSVHIQIAINMHTELVHACQRVQIVSANKTWGDALLYISWIVLTLDTYAQVQFFAKFRLFFVISKSKEIMHCTIFYASSYRCCLFLWNVYVDIRTIPDKHSCCNDYFAILLRLIL